MNFRNLFNFQTTEEKLNNYIKLYKEKSDLATEGGVLAKTFSEQEEIIKSIDFTDNRNLTLKKYKEFLSEHEKDVAVLCERNHKIEKSLGKIEQDVNMVPLINELRNLLLIEKSYKDGEVSKSVLHKMLMKASYPLRYADIIVINNSIINSITNQDFGKILLVQKLGDDGQLQNKWGLPGGRIELGEEAKTAACRELYEEVGINIDHPNQYLDVNNVFIEEALKYKASDCDITYFLTSIDPIQFPMAVQADEISYFEWVAPGDLEHYNFEHEECKKNICKILGVEYKEANLVGKIVKSFANGDISEKVFNDFAKSNSSLIEKANKHYFSEDEREKLADEGEAMSNGSFPIRNTQDLKDAIRSVGLAKDPTAARNWIKKRAKELGGTDLLPEDWDTEKSVGTEDIKPLTKESLDGEEKVLAEQNKNIQKAEEDEDKESNPILTTLYKALAEEYLAWYQYHIVSPFMQGNERKSAEKTFIEQANDELDDHSKKLLQRISELGGDVARIKSPEDWFKLAECPYQAPELPYNVISLLKQNIESEECAIKRYKGLCELTQHIDPTTYLMSLEILKDEEEHLRNLRDYLEDIESIDKNPTPQTSENGTI